LEDRKRVLWVLHAVDMVASVSNSPYLHNIIMKWKWSEKRVNLWTRDGLKLSFIWRFHCISLCAYVYSLRFGPINGLNPECLCSWLESRRVVVILNCVVQWLQ
jgi:hypothetical protein